MTFERIGALFDVTLFPSLEIVVSSLLHLFVAARASDSDVEEEDGGNDVVVDIVDDFPSPDNVSACCGKASTALITERSAGVIWIPRRLPMLYIIIITVDKTNNVSAVVGCRL